MLPRMAWRDALSRPAETAALVALLAVSVLLAALSVGLQQAVAGTDGESDSVGGVNW